MTDDPQPGPRQREFGERGRSAVAGAVIDIDQLEGTNAGTGGLDIMDERGDIALLVTHGHDDAEPGLAV